MSEIENALAWADHKKAAIVPAHTLAAEVRRLRAELAAAQEVILAQSHAKEVLAEDLDASQKEVTRLKACVILGDAGMAIARKNIINEDEVVAPYLAMKARAEEAEAKLATAKATGRREMAREVLATFPNSIHDCPTLKKWLEDQAKGGA